MNTNLAIERRASCVGDLRETFALIDAKRWEWAAALLAECGRTAAAERALAYSDEHRMLADRLGGAVAIGSEEAA